MDIPVWVNGEQLWVKGVEKKTTCDDVIKVLLGQDTEDYSLFENWKGVERRLRGVSKIWKIWREWGDAQGEVRLTLKKDGKESSKERRSRYSKAHRRRKSSHPQSIEVLLKLILIQGETIQSQLKKLKDKEEEIKQIEEAKHKERVSLHGSNYVLDTYFEKESDSGVVTEYQCGNTSPPEEADPTLASKLEFLERIVKTNKKIEKEEETLVKLFVALREYGENQVIQDLKRLRLDSERFSEELETNRENLTVLENSISDRKDHLEKLNTELEESEKETARLLEVIQSYSSPETYPGTSENDGNTFGLLEAIV